MNENLVKFKPLIFNGVYTISHDGQHRTFKVKTQAADARFAANERIIRLLTGSDNENDYEGFGFVHPNCIIVWNKKRLVDKKWQAYADLLFAMITQGEKSIYYLKGYRLHISLTCLVCNRLLSTPESIELGIGPKCAERY